MICAIIFSAVVFNDAGAGAQNKISETAVEAIAYASDYYSAADYSTSAPIVTTENTITVKYKMFGNFKTGGYAYLSSFSYSDEFFAFDSSVFSPAIARASIALAAASYRNDPPGSYIRRAIIDMGYNIVVSRGYDIKDDEDGGMAADVQDTVAYTIGRRLANISGKYRFIYCIVLRGTEGAGEWLSNIDTGVSSDADHEGFRRTADALLAEISKRITTKAENNIIWITGHSRGGAVANLLGATITESQIFASRDNIYVYTFGSPNTTTKAGVYDNIYNIINPDDIITVLPPERWGFHRFGDSIELSRDAAVYSKMKRNFYELTEGTEYTSLGGTEEFKQIVARWCPKPNDYYDKGVIGYSPYDIISIVLTDIQNALTKFSAAQLIQFSLYHNSGIKFVYYCYENYMAIACGHCYESYIAWINATWPDEGTISEVSESRGSIAA